MSQYLSVRLVYCCNEEIRHETQSGWMQWKQYSIAYNWIRMIGGVLFGKSEGIWITKNACKKCKQKRTKWFKNGVSIPWQYLTKEKIHVDCRNDNQ